MTIYYRRTPGVRRRNATHHIATAVDGVARCGARCTPPTWEATEDAPRPARDYLCWHCWRYTQSDARKAMGKTCPQT